MFTFTLLLLVITITLACPFAGLFKGVNLGADAHAKRNVAAAPKRAEPAKRAQQQLTIDTVFILTSRVKTPASPVFGQGFPVGFTVNGIEAPELNVTVGHTYNFTVISACEHPFYLSNDPRGRGRLPMTEGWVDINGNSVTPPSGPGTNNQICNGRSILWTAPADQVGKTLTYQCFVHDNMGFVVNVQEESLCDKYTAEFETTVLNNAGLVGAIVNNLLAQLLNPQSVLLEYFDGTVPTGSTDFTQKANGAALQTLQSEFVSFFGQLLGCDDGSIPPFTGSLADSHANLPIGAFEFDTFVGLLNQSLSQFMSNSDIVSLQAAINGVNVRGQVCNVQADCFSGSLCDAYSNVSAAGTLEPGSNLNFVTNLVDELFKLVLADSQLQAFFNGQTPPGSTDFTSNAADFTNLKNAFIAFLGDADFLACTDPAFPTSNIDVNALKSIHAGVPVTESLFQHFNDLFDEAASNVGMNASDVLSLRALLNGTEPQICNQPGCSSIPAAAGSTVFNVGVKAKDNTNVWFGQGFPAGYTLNGVFNQGVNLVVGQQYVFQVNVSCFHPFYFTSGFGAGSPEITEGVQLGIGQNTCLGKTTIFQPQADQVGSTIFYQCRNHQFMGGLLCIVGSAADANQPCLISALPPASGSSLSPCDDLVQAVQSNAALKSQFANSNATLTKAFTDVLTAAFADTQLQSAFTGQTVAALATPFAQFFGNNLGCSDNTITSFSVTPAPDIKAVHAGLNIVQTQFDDFNSKILNEFSNFAGNAGVGMSAANLAKVSAFLNATSSDICTNCQGFQAQTLCESWAGNAGAAQFGGDQTKMMTAIITAVFTTLTSDPVVVSFFNSSVPCNSRDFVNDQINQGVLVTQLVAFFGSAGALGCTQSNFPQYTGLTDMGQLHQFMPISSNVFAFFNNAVIQAIQAVLPNVASHSDIAAVQSLLVSPGISVICNQPDCQIKPSGTWKKKCTSDTVPVLTNTIPGAPAPGTMPPSGAPGAPPGAPPPGTTGVKNDASACTLGALAATLAIAATVVA